MGLFCWANFCELSFSIVSPRICACASASACCCAKPSLLSHSRTVLNGIKWMNRLNDCDCMWLLSPQYHISRNNCSNVYIFLAIVLKLLFIRVVRINKSKLSMSFISKQFIQYSEILIGFIYIFGTHKWKRSHSYSAVNSLH